MGTLVADFDPARFIEKKEIKKMDTFIHYGIAAGCQAIADAGLEVTEANAERIGVAIGDQALDLQILKEVQKGNW